MKKTTKLLSLILAGIMLMLCFAACNDTTPPAGNGSSDSQSESANQPEASLKDTTVRIAGMTGPTGIGLVSLMDKSEENDRDKWRGWGCG